MYEDKVAYNIVRGREGERERKREKERHTGIIFITTYI